VPAHDDVDQEHVIEEIADDVALPTSPLPPSSIIPSSLPHQSPRTSPSQAAEGTSILILKLKARVKKLERLNKVKSSKLRSLKKVGTSQRVESSEDEENVFNQGRISSKEEMETEEEEIIKSINEIPAQKAAKRKRLREQAKEAKDLKKQLEVVADEDDDVFVEATPIGTKVPVVNYEIVMLNNKPREDLEDLWKIVKARFSTSKPTNFTDDYLLDTLKNLFKKIDAQDVIWRIQQTEHGQALVKSWKLLTSCGVHIITF
nr:hypothetical protein [Tanacetum cinerariifolium]